MDQAEIENECQLEQIKALVDKLHKFRFQAAGKSDHQAVKYQLSIRWIDLYRSLFKLKLLQLHALPDQPLRLQTLMQSGLLASEKEVSDCSDPEPPFVQEQPDSSDEVIPEMSGEEDDLGDSSDKQKDKKKKRKPRKKKDKPVEVELDLSGDQLVADFAAKLHSLDILMVSKKPQQRAKPNASQ
jgi:hypothetical protein